MRAKGWREKHISYLIALLSANSCHISIINSCSCSFDISESNLAGSKYGNTVCGLFALYGDSTDEDKDKERYAAIC